MSQYSISLWSTEVDSIDISAWYYQLLYRPINCLIKIMETKTNNVLWLPGAYLKQFVKSYSSSIRSKDDCKMHMNVPQYLIENHINSNVAHSAREKLSTIRTYQSNFRLQLFQQKLTIWRIFYFFVQWSLQQRYTLITLLIICL